MAYVLIFFPLAIMILLAVVHIHGQNKIRKSQQHKRVVNRLRDL